MSSREIIWREYIDAKEIINDLAIEYCDSSAEPGNQSKEYQALTRALVAIEDKIEFWNPQREIQF